MTRPADPRDYPHRPFLAVSAAIFCQGRVLLVRRARPSTRPVYTLPGGVVEAGETLHEAVRREIHEETSLDIEPGPLAGHREFILRDERGRVLRHFVIMAFTAHWRAGEIVLNGELSEARWVVPADVAGFPATEGLAEIVDAAAAQIAAWT